MNTVAGERPDHNSLGKAAFIVGVIGLVLAFVPIIGFVSWLLCPLAILFGLIALRKPARSLAIAGIIAGAIGLVICFQWISGTKAVGEAMSADTFNTTGESRDLSEAPIMDASITGLYTELENNKVAAGQKYGGNRLHFSNEKIADFSGDAQNPSMSFVGKEDNYLVYNVPVSFSADDAKAIGAMAKGDAASFTCTEISEGFGDGYSLSGCKLD